MDIGGALQQAIIDRAVAYIGLVWLFLAICCGLYASEKKRRFWLWLTLSIVLGPIAWYRLLKLGYAVPDEVAMECPRCGKRTRTDMKTCVHCRLSTSTEKKDRAGNLGRTAATWLFTAKAMAGKARQAADKAAAAQRSKTGGG